MRVALTGLLLSLAACGAMGAAKVDGSSQRSYEHSLEAVRQSVPAADRARFEAALQLLRASAFTKSDSRAEMDRRMRADLDGKTAAGIVEDAARQRRDVTNAALDNIFKLKKRMKAELRELDDSDDATK